jgi:hypothetical protein
MPAIEDEFRPAPDEWLKVERRRKQKWSFLSETMAELLARPEPSLEWLIQDLWVDKSRGLIAGHPGVGKTWVALDMLLSVSSGQLCMGKYPPIVTGATLLVEEEASLLNLARRVHCMARGRGLKDSDLTNFHHVTRQFLKIPKHEKELTEFIKDKQIKFVVFDSLRRFHNAKENSSDEMQPVLESFARINFETGASVLLIHHLAKQGNEFGGKKSIFERMRGTSDLWAWRDCILGMEGEEESSTSTCSFQFRDAESTSPITIKRLVDPESGAISLTALALEESEEYAPKCAAILDYMKTQYGSVTKEAIFQSVKGRKAEFVKIFRLMESKKMVRKDGLKWAIQETNGDVPY